MSENWALNKSLTPCRRLGLGKSVRNRGVQPKTPTTPLSHKEFGVKKYKSSENISNGEPITPVLSNTTNLFKTPSEGTPKSIYPSSSQVRKNKLSLSRNWKENLIKKKLEFANKLPPRLIDSNSPNCESEVKPTEKPEKIEEKRPISPTIFSDESDSSSDQESGSSSLTATTSEEKDIPDDTHAEKMHNLQQNIKIWRSGCIEALGDLLIKSNIPDMSTLLDAMRIPYDVLDYDNSTQIFADSD